MEPEEAEAINALAQEASSEESLAAVVQRDFSRPQRFSTKSLEGLRRTLASALPELDDALKAIFKLPLRTEAMEIDEVGATGLFDDLDAPFALAEFKVAGQPAWIQWEIRSAVKAIELLLGSDGEPEPRRLSSIEDHLLSDIFGSVVNVIAKALQLDASELTVASKPEEISNWQDAGVDAEEHRLMLALKLEGIGESSSFHVYLPGVKLGQDPTGEGGASAALPNHLHSVSIEFGAHLGCSEIPLNDLLSLELGDVIPLGTLLSEPLQVLVEGFECGTAEMGTHNGNRAIRVIEVSPRLDGIA